MSRLCYCIRANANIFPVFRPNSFRRCRTLKVLAKHSEIYFILNVFKSRYHRMWIHRYSISVMHTVVLTARNRE